MAQTDYPGDLQQAAAKRRQTPEERAATQPGLRQQPWYQGAANLKPRSPALGYPNDAQDQAATLAQMQAIGGRAASTAMPTPYSSPDPAPAPVTGNPARAQRMQQQFDTPVTRGDAPVATPHVGSQFMQDAAQARAAGLYDLSREWLTNFAGGDVNTLPGGPGAAAKQLPAVSPGTSGPSMSDITLSALGARRAPGTEASRTGQASTAAPARQADLGAGSLKASAQPTPFDGNGLRMPDFQPTPAPAGNGFARTGLSDGSGQAIVGKRDANGHMSFSNRPEDTAGADGSLRGYGQGNLSVISGGQEGMERNLRAVQIMQQARAERAPVGGGLTIVPDSTRGTQLEQRRDARRQAQAAPGYAQDQQQSQPHRGDEQDPQQVQIATQKARQELALGGLQLEQVRRDAELRARAQSGDQQALQTLRSLSPDKSRFVPVQVDAGTDALGNQRFRNSAIDSYTGQYVDAAAAPSQAAAPKAQSYVNGQVYTDAKGNRARYDNGQWNPL